MKTILFLDDDTRRTDEIRLRLRAVACELLTVETAAECIVRLGEARFDLVLLDHDLGGETFVESSRDDCGMEVVRWLRANGGEHGAFIVHTMNTIAAAAMYIDLNAMGHRVMQAPFGSPRFYEMLYAEIGVRAPNVPAAKISFVDRLRRMLRRLRGSV